MAHIGTAVTGPLVALVALLSCSPVTGASTPEAERASVTLLFTADLHSRLFPEVQSTGDQDAVPAPGGSGDTSVGGLARIASLVNAERGKTEATFFLDAGDLVEGSALYPRFAGAPELEGMAAAGVDARALGNHDGALLALHGRAQLDPPLLAANLVGELGPAVEPLTILRRGGVTVAVIGAGRLEAARPDLADATEAVREAVAGVRAEADVVVLLSHLGSELDRALLDRVSGVDVVLGGHSHDVVPPAATALDCGPRAAEELGCRSRPVTLVHAGAYGRLVGRVRLLVSRAPEDLGASRDSTGWESSPSAGPSVVLETRVEHLPVGPEVPEDPKVAAVLDPYLRTLVEEGLFHPLATAPRRVARYGPGGGDSALGNFVAAAARAGSGADLSVIPASALRADIEAGEVTGDDLHRVLPFEDRLVALTPSGAELTAALRRLSESACAAGATDVHVDGATLAIGCGAGTGELRVSGARVEPASSYRLLTTTFLTGEGRPFDLPARVVGDARGGEGLRERVARVARGLPPCAPDATGLPCLDERVGARVDGRIRMAGGPR